MVVQPCFAVEVGAFGQLVAPCEIAVVVVIGNLVEIDAARQLGSERLAVFQAERGAVVQASFAVVRHIFDAGAACVFGLQIAKLAANACAA